MTDYHYQLNYQMPMILSDPHQEPMEEDDLGELLQELGPPLTPTDADQYIINSVGKQINIADEFSGNPAQRRVDDEFQKMQMELLSDEPQFVEPTINPSAGEQLMPINYQYQQELINYQGNNGNNAIGYDYRPNDNNWQRLEPVAYEDPSIALENPQDDLQADILREKNRGYSAQCLQRKKEKRVNGRAESEQLIVDVQQLEQQNLERESLLFFATNTVLSPFLGGNNQIFDPSEINEWLKYYQSQTQIIRDSVEYTKNNDSNVQRLGNSLQNATTKALEAAYNLLHKNEKAAELKVNVKTFGSRNTRAKQEEESCRYEYQIALNRIDLDEQQQLAELLNVTWNYFCFPVSEILRNHPMEVLDYAKDGGQEAQYHKLRHFLFQDPG